MNNLIKQFERQTNLDVYSLGLDRAKWESRLEAYTLLIVRECANVGLETHGNYDVHDDILKHFGVEETSIKIGSRVKVISGFNVGAKGTVSYIEPSGKLWVRRDGANSDVFYHSEEVVGVEHD